jgi:hypothetical protein
MTVERLRRLDDEELGSAVGTLEIDWPPAADVTGAVLRDIDEARPPRRRLSRTAIVLLVAAAILALAAAAAATRFAFDFGGIAIRSVPTMPTLPASPVEPAVVGRPVSVEAAEEALGSRLPIPTELGAPDEVWLQREMTSFEPQEHGIVVAMAWRPRPGLPKIPGTPYGATLFVFQGDDIVAVKGVAAPFTPIPAHDAVWIDAQHELDLLVDGHIRAFRVTGTVLLWQNGELAERLETALPRRAVVRIAFPPGT